MRRTLLAVLFAFALGAHANHTAAVPECGPDACPVDAARAPFPLAGAPAAQAAGRLLVVNAAEFDAAVNALFVVADAEIDGL